MPAMTDIGERLRALNDGNRWPMMDEAADEIERLRAALNDILTECDDAPMSHTMLVVTIQRIARAALTAGK
jgi:hypothetical protein